MLSESEIGNNIRKIRLSRGFTLDALAQKTGFTKGYLSKVEHSSKAPPVSTLINIAVGLGVNISDIFGQIEEYRSFSMVKKRDRQIMARDGTAFGYSYETLAHSFSPKRMEPYILTIPANIRKNPMFRHKGEEMLFVLKGNMRFIYGDNEYIVEEGDCIYFDSGIAHRGFQIGNQAVQCLLVIYTPEHA